MAKIIRQHPKPAHPTHPAKPFTAAQQRAFLHFLRSKAYKQAQARKHARIKARNRAARLRGAIRPEIAWDGSEWAPETYWILGQNDVKDTCVMTAIANDLLLEHWARTSDEEIVAAGENLSIEEALNYVKDHGLAGWELESFKEVPATYAYASVPGVIFGVKTPEGPHAVVATGDRTVVSWGHILPIAPPMRIEEAWLLNWRNNGGERLSPEWP